MAEHLPECRVRTYTTDDGMVYEVAGDLCICAALRACEQRAYTLGIEVGKHDGWLAGQAAGVAAARDAVVPWLPHSANCNIRHYEGVCDCECAPILAAIDALKEKP